MYRGVGALPWWVFAIVGYVAIGYLVCAPSMEQKFEKRPWWAVNIPPLRVLGAAMIWPVWLIRRWGR